MDKKTRNTYFEISRLFEKLFQSLSVRKKKSSAAALRLLHCLMPIFIFCWVNDCLIICRRHRFSFVCVKASIKCMGMNVFRVLLCPSSARRPFCVSVRGAERPQPRDRRPCASNVRFRGLLASGSGFCSRPPRPPLSFFEAIQTEQLRLQFPLNDATIQAGRCWRSVTAAFRFPTFAVVFSWAARRLAAIMDGGDYSSGLENPLYGELKYFCRKIQEAYSELKEDLTPYRDDRFYRWVLPFARDSNETVAAAIYGDLVCELVSLGSGESGNRKWMDGQSSPSLQFPLW